MRDRLAAQAALRTMAPFILLLPLLALLVWLAVSRGLKPPERIAREVKARGPAVLDPLPEQHEPQEIRPLVAALNDLLPRLSRALEMQRAFVADAAHELRTPLTALRLRLQLAERAHSESERPAAFESLEQGLARATHLVEQLLTLAREEPGAEPHPAENVDLGALAQEVVVDMPPWPRPGESISASRGRSTVWSCTASAPRCLQSRGQRCALYASGRTGRCQRGTRRAGTALRCDRQRPGQSRR